ncbi:hypothetical protein ATM17_14610 [Sphingopyxis macrogoltabida]|uniref:Uncharacterized protein n=1 Tax=Sphingopyxis macrogoltabida TaxID=33050 RepID=A0AAC8Z1P6_SPHMC|nr:hypothetical protein ATM17_14610 [Sphingopyxis macrogoltabida]
MPCRDGPARAAKKIDERVARFDSRSVGAGLVGSACSVHFARGDPGDANMSAFGAPYGPVAIPDMRGRAGKGLAGSDDRGSKKRKHGFAT